MQRLRNLMFTFTGPVHLAILTHHHHNSIHNKIDNNNNTVSVTYTHKKSIFSPISYRSGILSSNFVSYSPSNIHNSKDDSVQ